VADALSSSHRTELRQLITILVKTSKDITFYPDNSPVIERSLQQVADAVGSAAKIADPLVFEVQQQQFLAQGVPLLEDAGPEQQFAAQLFGLGVRVLEIGSGAEPAGVNSFLTAIHEAHKQGMDFESLAERVEHLGTSGLRLYPAVRLDASRLIEGPVSDSDDEQPGSVHVAAGTATVQETEERATRLLGEFATRLDVPEEDSGQLLEYIRDTDCIATAAGELCTLPANVATQSLFRKLFSSMSQTADRAHRSPPSIRAELFSELSRAIETMDPEVRDTFFREKLMAGAEPDTGVLALLSQLSDEIIADQLADSLLLHDGAEAAAQTYFLNMPVPAERRNNIVELAYMRVTENGTVSPLVEEMLRSVRRAEPPVEVAKPARDDDAADGSAAAPPDPAVLALTEEQRREAERLAKTALDHVEEHNARTMLALLNSENEPERLARILDALATLHMRILGNPAGFGTANEIVQAYVHKRAFYVGPEMDDTARQVVDMLNGAISAACTGETVKALIDLTVLSDESSGVYNEIVDYLNLIGEPAYRTLFDELRNESSRSRRMAARKLAVSIGDPFIALLTDNVANEPWYVIRNVASILGEMRSDKGIEFLSQALGHSDQRVRREAVNSLGKTGSQKAARTLTAVLSNDDIETVQAAVRWLGLLGNVDAVPNLVDLMDTLGHSSANRQLKLSIIESLMQIGSTRALDGLERVKRARKWFFFKRDSVLADAATRAAEKIRGQTGGGTH